MADKDASSSSIIIVDEGGIVLIKGWVYGGLQKSSELDDVVRDVL